MKTLLLLFIFLLCDQLYVLGSLFYG